ncbi:MAG: peptidoglycan DD-metalloendopeptidase family protein [Pseudomonadota bacterium]
MKATRSTRYGVLLLGTLALAGCEDGFDFDIRNGLGGFDTSRAALAATAPRPEPDARGVISYPGYQVAVAEQGDTVNTIAARLGLSGDELASFNGIAPDVALRNGEILALPGRVSPGIGSTGDVDIANIAGAAIDSAPQDAARPPTDVQTSALPQGPEPVRHKVERGETAFTISRLYGVPVRSLAEWNGLGADLAIREGQFLLIPVITSAAPQADVTNPGDGSATPAPPSSTTPVPEADDASGSQIASEEPAPAPTPVADTAEFLTPVTGPVIRGYSKGRNEGVDFGVPGGTEVRAAADGTVAAITQNTAGIPIIVVRHEGNLLTVYTQLDDVKVEKGDAVSRGDAIATVREGNPSFLHFEVRNGLESVDPASFLNI